MRLHANHKSDLMFFSFSFAKAMGRCLPNKVRQSDKVSLVWKVVPGDSVDSGWKWINKADPLSL